MLYFHISRVKRAHAHVKQSDGRTVIMDGMGQGDGRIAQSDFRYQIANDKSCPSVRPNIKDAGGRSEELRSRNRITVISDQTTGSFHSIEAGQVKKRDNASRAFFSGVRIFSTLIA